MLRPRSVTEWEELIDRERQRSTSHRFLLVGLMLLAVVAALLVGLGLIFFTRVSGDRAFELVFAVAGLSATALYFILRGRKARCPHCAFSWEISHELAANVDDWRECPECGLPLQRPALDAWVAAQHHEPRIGNPSHPRPWPATTDDD